MFKGKWTKNPVIIGGVIVGVIYYLSRRNTSSGLVSGYGNTDYGGASPVSSNIYGGSGALARGQGEGIQWDTGRYVNPSRYQP